MNSVNGKQMTTELFKDRKGINIQRIVYYKKKIGWHIENRSNNNWLQHKDWLQEKINYKYKKIMIKRTVC